MRYPKVTNYYITSRKVVLEFVHYNYDCAEGYRFGMAVEAPQSSLW